MEYVIARDGGEGMEFWTLFTPSRWTTDLNEAHGWSTTQRADLEEGEYWVVTSMHRVIDEVIPR